jgi:multidrug efflux pump subunit AcrB
MWIVQTALRRPYTFVVLAILIFLFGTLSTIRTPKDIFPSIDIPVVAVVFQYNGMLPQDVSGRFVYFFERTVLATTTDIEHIESNSMIDYGIVKIFFDNHVNVAAALSLVTATAQTVLKFFPRGSVPPFVLFYNATSVPVIQMTASSATVPETILFDYSNNVIRPALASVQGSAVLTPYGGKYRMVIADLNPEAMEANALSPQDVVDQLNRQNLILPTGTIKMGKYEWDVMLTDQPRSIPEMNFFPIKKANGTLIYLKDIAFVHDGAIPQTNMVRVNGNRAVLMPIVKAGDVSTLDIVQGVKDRMPLIEETVPKGMRLDLVGDQSVFVKAAIEGVVREAVIAAVLTALMILLFLGSLRSTFIIAISIPLSVLTSITLLSLIGQTINTLTLGGLALAVGMLVDEATVTIENFNYHMELGKDIETAILDGAQQIVIPALLSLLSISIVFAPMWLLTGVSFYLFTPLAEAVVFAMAASFILSRTLVPTLAIYLLRNTVHQHGHGEALPPTRNPFVLFQRAFERGFARMRARYHDMLAGILSVRGLFVGVFLAFTVLSVVGLGPWLGEIFFPDVDAGVMYMHIRAQTGTRIEETARLCQEVEDYIRTVIPRDQIKSFVDNIDLPVAGIPLAYLSTGSFGPEDADVLITLDPDKHGPTAQYVAFLRRELPRHFPGTTFYFMPADMNTQILNFGRPSPIDIQVTGPDLDNDYQFALRLYRDLVHVPGLVDVHLAQPFNYPTLQVDVDRSYAMMVGLTEADVTNSMLTSLYSNLQVSPNFYLNYKTGITYFLVGQTPQYRIDTMNDFINMPISAPGTFATAGRTAQILGALSSIKVVGRPGMVSHYNVQPMEEIFAAVQGRDLGSVARDMDQIIAKNMKYRPPGVAVAIRGQVDTMRTAYTQLFSGLVGSVVLIYLLLVVNFQSWLDPFIIITALPAAIAGIVWMLFITHTPLSVPALTGAIMCMGVATANSILVVSFAREMLAEGRNSNQAALEAGFVRLRPVLMTASAMIIGMIPMSLGLGDGGEMNAPLGRAVIGGLLFATFSTLVFVPSVFAILHRKDNAGAVSAPPQASAHAH